MLFYDKTLLRVALPHVVVATVVSAAVVLATIVSPFASVVSAQGFNGQSERFFNGQSELLNGESNDVISDVTSRYRPCEVGQDIDILVMMDASGSLNGGQGADPDGQYRREALENLRQNLSGKQYAANGEGISDSKPVIRVALYSFHNAVKRAVDFKPLTSTHPSDDEINNSLLLNEKNNNTDYVRALRSVIGAFNNESEKSNCRLLVFFTDGIYDPNNQVDSQRLTKRTAEELAGKLLGDVCGASGSSSGAIADDFRELGIQTYAVLLGESFLQTIQDMGSANANKRLVSVASLRAWKAITAEPTDQNSEFVLADADMDGMQPVDCDRHQNEQQGRIVGLQGLDDLQVALLETIETAAEPELLYWRDCLIAPTDQLNTGEDEKVQDKQDRQPDERKSGELPDSRFIDSIMLYAYGGTITHYRLQEQEGNNGGDAWRSVRGGNRLRLEQGERLQGLKAGWTLAVKVVPSAGGNSEDDSQEVSLRCYAKPAKNVLQPFQVELRAEVKSNGAVQSNSGVEPGSEVTSNPEVDETFETNGDVAEKIFINIGPPDSAQDADDLGDTQDAGSAHKQMYHLVAVPSTQSTLPELEVSELEICSIDIEWFEVAHPATGESRRFQSLECDEVDGVPNTLIRLDGYEYQPVCSHVFEAGEEIAGYVRPMFTENIFWESDTRFGLQISTGHSMQVVCRSIPALYGCNEELEITNMHKEVPKEPLQGEVACVLRLPSTGTSAISSFWQPDAASELPEPLNWQINEVALDDNVFLTKDEPVIDTDGNQLAALSENGLTVLLHEGLFDYINASSSSNNTQDASSSSNTESVPTRFTFTTGNALTDSAWMIDGALKLQIAWDTDNVHNWEVSTLNSKASQQTLVDAVVHTRSFVVKADFLSRSNYYQSSIITVVILIASLVLSYLMLCWVLAFNLTLPDPRGFWAYRTELEISRRASDGFLSVLGSSTGIQLSSREVMKGSAKATGKRHKQLLARFSNGEHLTISLQRAAWFNLKGLLRGGWGKIQTRTAQHRTASGSMDASLIATNCPGVSLSTTQTAFNQLTVVELRVRSSDDTVIGTLWCLEPKQSHTSRREHVPVSEVQNLVNKLSSDVSSSHTQAASHLGTEQNLQPHESRSKSHTGTASPGGVPTASGLEKPPGLKPPTMRHDTRSGKPQKSPEIKPPR